MLKLKLKLTLFALVATFSFSAPAAEPSPAPDAGTTAYQSTSSSQGPVNQQAAPYREGCYVGNRCSGRFLTAYHTRAQCLKEPNRSWLTRDGHCYYR